MIFLFSFSTDYAYLRTLNSQSYNLQTKFRKNRWQFVVIHILHYDENNFQKNLRIDVEGFFLCHPVTY